MKTYARFLPELLCPLAFVVARVLSDDESNKTTRTGNRSRLNLDGKVMVPSAETPYAAVGHSSFITMQSQVLSRERLGTHTK